MIQGMLLFCILLCGQSWAQNQPAQLALQALEDLKFIVDETNYEDLGFRSLSELEELKLGKPLPVHFVGLDKIERYRGTTVDELYGAARELVFPVLVGGVARTSVVMKKDGEKWEVAGFGRKRMTRALSLTEKIRSYSQEKEEKDYFAIEMPSLFLLFICFKADEQTMVTYVGEETAQSGHSSEPSGLTVEEQLRKDIFSEFENAVRPFDVELLDRIRMLAEVAQDPLSSKLSDE